MSSFNVKPGVDWNAIKADFDAGHSLSECTRRQCARGIRITRHAIEKRRDKEGWNQAAQMKAATAMLPSVVAQATGHAMTRHRSPEQAAAILQSLQKGLPYRTAARLAGMSEDTLAKWRDEDPDFAALCEQSVELWHATMIGHVESAAPRDWKAAQWRLQTHGKTKADYGDANRAGTTINVLVNVPRGTDTAESIVTIDHDPKT